MSVPDPRMRIADSDRERAMADLAMHYADGRLDHEEYDERLDAIWTARTRADLALLFSDLPRMQPAQPSRTPARAPRPAGSRFRVPLVPLIAVLVVLSILTEAPFWLLVFPLLWFRMRRHGAACPPGRQHPYPPRSQPHGHTDYRRPRRSHG
jgi:hypothetical protein